MLESSRSPKRPKVFHGSSTGAPISNLVAFDRPDFSEPALTVAFFVTENGKTEKLLVHKEHACYYSPIFKAALNSSSQEGRTGEYGVEGTTLRAFKLLEQWIYYQSLNLLLLKMEVDERAEGNWPLIDAEQQNLFEL
ncbi:uncharacterized protein PAC_01014 [Phialocephala subalpina]|uniref:BTB domain-containing protein n=1 Tax=Phialocephala subalpina TaxID=576137 RepID=A0A1L7WEJ0_9HELO|nr:uncharacterized protein PAC_01014 [Phialocephala subalpina]